MAYIDLSNPSNQLMINENEEFHAASTMKTPVMIELYKQASEGRFGMEDSILIKRVATLYIRMEHYSFTDNFLKT